jgi:hypothetical protein
MTVHPAGDLQAFGGRGDHERPAIFRADLAGHEAAAGETIENAGQRRAVVRQAAMKFGDGRRRRRRKQREDVTLALREAVVTQLRQVEADPVGRSVDGWNQAQ